MEYEILFRGKRLDNGEWIEGYYVLGESDHLSYIIPKNNSYESAKPVIDETVGQYTGLTDKNGKKIFKGDIIKTNKYGTVRDGATWSGQDTYVVGFADGTFYIENTWRRFCLRPDVGAEVVGNIHDNPEFWRCNRELNR